MESVAGVRVGGGATPRGSETGDVEVARSCVGEVCEVVAGVGVVTSACSSSDVGVCVWVEVGKCEVGMGSVAKCGDDECA